MQKKRHEMYKKCAFYTAKASPQGEAQLMLNID